MEDKVVVCKSCQRAVLAEHTDEQGRCIFCRPTEPERKQAEKEQEKNAPKPIPYVARPRSEEKPRE